MTEIDIRLERYLGIPVPERESRPQLEKIAESNDPDVLVNLAGNPSFILEWLAHLHSQIPHHHKSKSRSHQKGFLCLGQKN